MTAQRENPGARRHQLEGLVEKPEPLDVARALRREHRPDCHLMQFAGGWNVAPDPRAIVGLTSRFRGAVVNEFLRLRTGDASANWTRVGKGFTSLDGRRASARSLDRRGQMIRLWFTTRVAGPIRWGHLSSFGLGLFRPVPG